MFEFSIGTLVVIGFVLIWFWNSLYIIKEWERGVVLRLGRMLPQAKGAYRDARRSSAGHHHPRQYLGKSECRLLFPHC